MLRLCKSQSQSIVYRRSQVRSHSNVGMVLRTDVVLTPQSLPVSKIGNDAGGVGENKVSEFVFGGLTG